MHPDAIRILLPQTCFDGEGDGAGGQRSCSGAGTGIMMPGFGCWSPASFFLPIRRVRGNPSTDRAARRPCAARCLALCLFQFYRILIRLQIINIIIFDRFQQRFWFCLVRSTAATGQVRAIHPWLGIHRGRIPLAVRKRGVGDSKQGGMRTRNDIHFCNYTNDS